ncbi:rhodanese-like domain-containing protein [Thiohalophilus sp.]|uniref:rhodanese-like domain-containing protein n=1 Tax=Thiohalophilus sp. TaxID=3028392 RepID=UPI002ACE4BDC|nr:rhodanese-like domain-containing protein [Thiohalophilus sp.]MDZ7661039.1 rhodanese-like domain-containing protein [Thiohalophilus sp.]
MKKFTPRDLKTHLEQSTEPPFLLDVREPWEYETCHIDGSTLVPMGRIQSAVESLDKNQETVVICHHGIRSRAVAIFLEREGFNNVINLEGGVDRWADEVDPQMQKYR